MFMEAFPVIVFVITRKRRLLRPAISKLVGSFLKVEIIIHCRVDFFYGWGGFFVRGGQI